jgi:hypothetical protein
VAERPFAPGHLGELTQLVPFEMVDEALEATRTVQSRLRDLPSRVVVYLLLAACLFPETGYLGVWRKLTGALARPAGRCAFGERAGPGPPPDRRRAPAVAVRPAERLRGRHAGTRDTACWWSPSTAPR